MLQENKRNECIKKFKGYMFLLIISIILISIFPILILVVIFIFYKNRTEIKSYIGKSGIIDCIEIIFGENKVFQKIKEEILKTWEQNKKKESYYGKKDTYYKETYIIKNIEKVEKQDKVEDNYKKTLLTKKEYNSNQNNDIENTKDKDKFMPNNGKSIWDNYESVIDKFKK